MPFGFSTSSSKTKSSSSKSKSTSTSSSKTKETSGRGQKTEPSKGGKNEQDAAYHKAMKEFYAKGGSGKPGNKKPGY